MTHLSKAVVLLAYITVLLSACAPVGYIKPGMTGEGVARDRSECAEIARHQAFPVSNITKRYSMSCSLV